MHRRAGGGALLRWRHHEDLRRNGLSLPNGGDNGEVRIELAAGQALPQACADERVAEWDSTTSRWICGIDDDTTYSASTGLDLSAGSAFSIEPGYR